MHMDVRPVMFQTKDKVPEGTRNVYRTSRCSCQQQNPSCSPER